ncbi:MAG: hypothetical protein JWL76_2063 [Thermoleophilia bacterium]|nr:hypothetical protein [Thermoleophilia bacterium]
MTDHDPFASLSPRVFGVHPPASSDELPSLGDVVVGEIRFRGRPRTRAHVCDEQGRVPVGAGFFGGDDDQLDLCPTCFEPVRERPERAPTPEDQMRLAQVGIGADVPIVLDIRDEADLAALIDVLDTHDVRRIVVRTSLTIPHDPRIHLATRTTPSQSQSGPLRSFELQLQGLSHGPPMDPGLLAEIEAAKDARGVVHDAELADRYFEAMVAQQAAMHELMGRPEAIIEQGPVFPSFADEDDPLPS